MPKINPFVGLFLAIAAMNVVLFGWQRADMAALEARFEARIVRPGSPLRRTLHRHRGTLHRPGNPH